jgi:hypothetical protein
MALEEKEVVVRTLKRLRYGKECRGLSTCPLARALARSALKMTGLGGMACGINGWPEASYVLACISSPAVETAGYCESSPAGLLIRGLSSDLNARSIQPGIWESHRG